MLIPDLPEEQYHSRGELSSTQARLLLKAPALYKHSLTAPRATSDAFDLGTAVHTKVLGTGAGTIVYPEEHLTPSGNVSTSKDTKAWEAEQREKGLVPIGQSVADKADAMAESVLAHPKARMYFEAAAGREVTVISEIDGVPVRCRFDALTEETPDGRRVAVDLKTTAKTADNDGFTRSINTFGYHVQQGHYDATFEASEGRGLDDFLFVVVEKQAPFLVGVHRLDAVWADMARTAAREARKRWLECTESGVWPGYPDEVQTLAPPAYAVVEHEEKYESMEFKF